MCGHNIISETLTFWENTHRLYCFFERPAVWMHPKKRKTGREFRHQPCVTHTSHFLCAKGTGTSPLQVIVVNHVIFTDKALTQQKFWRLFFIYSDVFNLSCQATCFLALKESFLPCQSLDKLVCSSQFILKLHLVFILWEDIAYP